MKKLMTLCLSLCLFGTVLAENKATFLPISIYVEDFVEPFPAAAKRQMENKLTSLLTQSGIVGQDYLSQFFVTAKAVPLTKDILPGPPQQIAENMEITFYIADYLNQIVFSTMTLETKGVGTTETKAYMDAIRQLPIQSKKMVYFVQSGKDKILEYYNTKAEDMFSQARTLSAQHSYEQALFVLSCIPQECDKYAEATALGQEIWQAMYDFACTQHLQAARMAWAAEQNSEGAKKAGEHLSKIYPAANCYGDAMALYEEIKGKVLDDWKFEMKQQQDEVDLANKVVEAWREIGVAYGKGQQPSTTNLAWLH